MLCEVLQPIQTRRGVLQRGTLVDIPQGVFHRLFGKVRRVQQAFSELACGTCLYFGWKGVEHYCRHPHHNRLIAGVDCGGRDYIDRYRKTLPTKRENRLEPVPIEQVNATSTDTPKITQQKCEQ